MCEAERRSLVYLFKLRRTKTVLALFRQHEHDHRWIAAKDGWEAMENVIHLDGWARLTSTHLKASEIQSSLMQIGEFMKRISANAEQLDFNRMWEIIILAAFRKWLCGNKTKGLLPQLLTLIN